MKPSRDKVLAHFLEVLSSMGEEWEDSAVIAEDARILGDLNWRSVEIVYLVNELQNYYQQVFPFEEFLKVIEARESKDSTVSEWVEFIHQGLPDGA